MRWLSKRDGKDLIRQYVGLVSLNRCLVWSCLICCLSGIVSLCLYGLLEKMFTWMTCCKSMDREWNITMFCLAFNTPLPSLYPTIHCAIWAWLICLLFTCHKINLQSYREQSNTFSSSFPVNTGLFQKINPLGMQWLPLSCMWISEPVLRGYLDKGIKCIENKFSELWLVYYYPCTHFSFYLKKEAHSWDNLDEAWYLTFECNHFLHRRNTCWEPGVKNQE